MPVCLCAPMHSHMCSRGVLLSHLWKEPLIREDAIIKVSCGFCLKEEGAINVFDTKGRGRVCSRHKERAESMTTAITGAETESSLVLCYLLTLSLMRWHKNMPSPLKGKHFARVIFGILRQTPFSYTAKVCWFRLNNSSWFVGERCWLIHRKRSIRVNKQWASQDSPAVNSMALPCDRHGAIRLALLIGWYWLLMMSWVSSCRVQRGREACF